MKSVSERVIEWFLSNDTGVSSSAIVAVMTGNDSEKDGPDYPHDPADLGRCLRLLELIPEWKPRLPEMAKRGPVWTDLVARWHDLESTFHAEVGSGRRVGKKAPRTWDLLRKIRAPHEDAWMRSEIARETRSLQGH